jgi:hypothetical protein
MSHIARKAALASGDCDARWCGKSVASAVGIDEGRGPKVLGGRGLAGGACAHRQLGIVPAGPGESPLAKSAAWLDATRR